MEFTELGVGEMEQRGEWKWICDMGRVRKPVVVIVLAIATCTEQKGNG